METEVCVASGRGTVQLKCVIPTPEVTHSLLFVASLCDGDNTVLFTKDICLVKKENKVILVEIVTRE